MDTSYAIKVFDLSSNLIDMPADSFDIDVETLINGGSGSGYMTFPRAFNQIGAIGNGYRFQLYLPGQTDPWYDGRVTKIERTQRSTRADAKAYLEGWMTALNYNVVSEIITPGVQSNGVDNGQMDAGAYLTHLANTYLPAPPNQVPVTFGFSGANPVGLNLDRMQFDAVGMANVVDDVVKAILDNNAAVWEWLVSGTAAGAINFVWRAEQNPNIVGSASFANLFMSDVDQYQIVDDFTTMINLITAYGGKDPVTGMTVWGPYQNSSSISTYGVRQGKITRPSAVSQAQLNLFAKAYLQQYAFPIKSGSFRALVPDPTLTAGKWVQIFESPGNVQQLKLLRVNVKANKQRIEQICYVGLPLPAAEKLAQGPDPSGAYNSSRLGAKTPTDLRFSTDQVLGGINPIWTSTGGLPRIITYLAGVARIGNATITFPQTTISIGANGAYSIVLASDGTLSAQPASVAAQPGQIVLDDFTIVSGKVAGWWARAPRGGADASTGQNYQASIPPIAVDVTVTSATTTTGGGVAQITVSWTSGTIFWPDGSITAISSGSKQYLSLIHI